MRKKEPLFICESCVWLRENFIRVWFVNDSWFDRRTTTTRGFSRTGRDWDVDEEGRSISEKRRRKAGKRDAVRWDGDILPCPGHKPRPFFTLEGPTWLNLIIIVSFTYIYTFFKRRNYDCVGSIILVFLNLSLSLPLSLCITIVVTWVHSVRAGFLFFFFSKFANFFLSNWFNDCSWMNRNFRKTPFFCVGYFWKILQKKFNFNYVLFNVLINF